MTQQLFYVQLERALAVFHDPMTQEAGYFMLCTLLAPKFIFPYIVHKQGGLGLLAFGERGLDFLLIINAEQVVIRDTHQLHVIKDIAERTPYVVAV